MCPPDPESARKVRDTLSEPFCSDELLSRARHMEKQKLEGTAGG